MTTREHFCGLPVYPLRDVLQCVPLPVDMNASSVSSKWRCVIAPRFSASEAETSQESILSFLEAGIPVLCGRSSSSPAMAAGGAAGNASGSSAEDGVALLTSSAYNVFDKPQIAVKNGWGSPGTARDHSNFHVMVKSFQNVFEPSSRAGLEEDAALQHPLTEEEKAKLKEEEDEANAAAELPSQGTNAAAVPLMEALLELQLFHREDGVPLPPHAEHLTWPDVLEHKVVCDIATVATQGGFYRWWEMNDCGEVVNEAALTTSMMMLPVSGGSASNASTTRATAGPSSTGRTDGQIKEALYSTLQTTANTSTAAAAKLVICGPRGSYDWFVHDDISLTNGTVVSLNIFDTTDEELPTDSTLLPVLVVAVLEGNGPSLLQPPNLPTTSLALQSSVTIEQRAISYLWLDEVSYFLNRCKLWSSDPLIYQFVEQDLQDAEYVSSVLIPLLCELFRQCDTASGDDGNVTTNRLLCRRLVASLFTVATQATHYALSESSRKSLLSTVTTDNAAMAAVLHQPVLPIGRAARRSSSSSSTWTLREMLLWYLDARRLWPKPGCVLQVPTFYPEGRPANWKPLFLPIVYPPCKSSPVFGTEATTPELTLSEYLSMKRMDTKLNELRAFLQTRKNPPDDILDELF